MLSSTLFAHLALGEPSSILDQAVGERGLPMIDMRDNGKVADFVEALFGHGSAYTLSSSMREEAF